MEKLRYTITEQNMPENGFSLTPIFPYKDRIVDSVLIREYTGQRKPYCGMFYTVHIGKNIGKVTLKYWKNVNAFIPGGDKRTWILKGTPMQII